MRTVPLPAGEKNGPVRSEGRALLDALLRPCNVRLAAHTVGRDLGNLCARRREIRDCIDGALPGHPPLARLRLCVPPADGRRLLLLRLSTYSAEGL